MHKFTTGFKTVTILGYKMKRIARKHHKQFIEIPSYVALISDDSSEPVYFVRVEAKGICEEIMTDAYGHTLILGKKYFPEKYLQNVRSRKSNKKQFQLINRNVFVTPDQVFEALSGFHDNLAIDITK